jgi:hypothetical protein
LHFYKSINVHNDLATKLLNPYTNQLQNEMEPSSHWQQLDVSKSRRSEKLMGEESWNGDGDMRGGATMSV